MHELNEWQTSMGFYVRSTKFTLSGILLLVTWFDQKKKSTKGANNVGKE